MPAPSNRSTFSTHPMMGLPPRWKVSDMEPSYEAPASIINAASGNLTSNAINLSANSIVLQALFSSGDTSCDLIVTNDDGSGTYVQVAKFAGVNQLNAGNLMVGELVQGITLLGRAIKVQIANYAGSGTVTVTGKRMG